MKYAVRRLVAGIVIVPAVASAYFVMVALLIGAGAGANASPSEVWVSGLSAGVAVTLVFAGLALFKGAK